MVKKILVEQDEGKKIRLAMDLWLSDVRDVFFKHYRLSSKDLKIDKFGIQLLGLLDELINNKKVESNKDAYLICINKLVTLIHCFV